MEDKPQIVLIHDEVTVTTDYLITEEEFEELYAGLDLRNPEPGEYWRVGRVLGTKHIVKIIEQAYKTSDLPTCRKGEVYHGYDVEVVRGGKKLFIPLCLLYDRVNELEALVWLTE